MARSRIESGARAQRQYGTTSGQRLHGVAVADREDATYGMPLRGSGRHGPERAWRRGGAAVARRPSNEAEARATEGPAARGGVIGLPAFPGVSDVLQASARRAQLHACRHQQATGEGPDLRYTRPATTTLPPDAATLPPDTTTLPPSPLPQTPRRERYLTSAPASPRPSAHVHSCSLLPTSFLRPTAALCTSAPRQLPIHTAPHCSP
jgi:hypothetical protein